METNGKKVLEDETTVKVEDIIKSEDLESLEGGVSSSVEQSSTGIFGTAACCNDAVVIDR